MGKVKATACEQLLTGDPPTVYILEPDKARRLKAQTMLIPSPMQIHDAIMAIPYGKAKPCRHIQQELAREANADITCPAATKKFWRLVAEATEERRALGQEPIAPWWRVTRDGKPHNWLPGGPDHHCALLRAEGIEIGS